MSRSRSKSSNDRSARATGGLLPVPTAGTGQGNAAVGLIAADQGSYVDYGPELERAAGSWLPAILTCGLALLCLGSPYPAPRAATATIAVLLGAITLLRLTRRRHGVPAAMIAGLGAFPLLILLQAVLWQATGFTQAPAAAIHDGFLLVTACSAMTLTAWAGSDGGPRFRRALIALALLGSLQAWYGVMNFLAGNEHLLIYKRWAYPDSATGTLVSRNHFAYLLEITLPAAAAWMIGERSGGPGTTSAEHERAQARSFLLGLNAAVMVLALLLSKSRMGIMGLGISALAVTAMARPRGRGRGQAGRQSSRGGGRTGTSTTVAVLLLTGAALSFLVVLGIEPLVARFLNLGTDLEAGRLPIWNLAIAMFRDNPWIGQGWGAFEALEATYRTTPNGLTFRYAHNDYLQILAETGLVGASFALLLVLGFARRMVRLAAMPPDTAWRREALALGICILAVLAHSIADFGLRIPGVALTFAYTIGLFVRAADSADRSNRR